MLSLLAKFEAITECLKPLEQAEVPVKHYFSEGTYVREVMMPAGTVVVGKVHLERHLNYVVTGKAILITPLRSMTIVAPYCFESLAGEQKALHILEDMTYITVHRTDSTNPAEVEEAIIADRYDAESIKLLQESRLCLGLVQQ